VSERSRPLAPGGPPPPSNTATVAVPAGLVQPTDRRPVTRSEWRSALKPLLTSGRQRALRGTLVLLADLMSPDGRLSAERQRMARSIGLARRTLDRDIAAAVAEGWLIRVQRGQRHRQAVYWAAVPCRVAQQVTGDQSLHATAGILRPAVADSLHATVGILGSVSQHAEDEHPENGVLCTPPVGMPLSTYSPSVSEVQALEQDRYRRRDHNGSRGPSSSVVPKNELGAEPVGPPVSKPTRARPERGGREPLESIIEKVRAVRPRWSPAAITEAATRCAADGRTPAATLAALLAVADDPQTRGPGRVVADGPWWRAAAEHHRRPRALQVTIMVSLSSGPVPHRGNEDLLDPFPCLCEIRVDEALAAQASPHSARPRTLSCSGASSRRKDASSCL
jgi:hypothetical protein